MLGSARAAETASSSNFCVSLRYGPHVRWTADAIKQRRDKLGLTQQQLADRLEVSLRTVTAWESGASKPRRTSSLDRVLGSPPNGTGGHFDLTSMKLDQLIALQSAAAAEIASRAARGGANEEIVHPRDDPGTTFAQYDATAYANRANQRRTGS